MADRRASRPRSLVRYYGKWRVVSDVSMNVRRGEVVGLLGPNGAGKTTSLLHDRRPAAPGPRAA